MSSPQKTYKKTRPSTASASPTKTVITTHSVKTTIMPGSADDIARTHGLTEHQVELEHLRTIVQEMKREREVNESLTRDNTMLREQLSRAEHVRVEQMEHINKLDQVRIQQQSHISVLVQENKSLKDENASLLTDKEGLHKELLMASDYIVSLEDKCYRANKTSLDLLQRIRDLELEVETLKAYIIDLKARIAVYIPVKGDEIDKKLAEYINNYPDRQKLKIMFMRETEGVYEFGSKRVYVKVTQGKIRIQVGGGFLSIDEFLDQYTPVELEKLERRDPLKRFCDKVAVQKTLASQAGVESAPVRKAQSPAKKTKV